MQPQHPLDAWREKRGWTQAQLAHAVGVTEATISRLLAGKIAGLSKRAALSAFLVTQGAVDLATLLLGSDAEQASSKQFRGRR
jgi:transcriptional regulator with XRE-family HTH domain